MQKPAKTRPNSILNTLNTLMMNDSILTSRTPCDGKVSPVVRNTTKLNRTSNLDFLAKLQLICHQHTCNQVLLYIALKNAQSLSFLRDNLQVDQATDKSIVTFPISSPRTGVLARNSKTTTNPMCRFIKNRCVNHEIYTTIIRP